MCNLAIIYAVLYIFFNHFLISVASTNDPYRIVDTKTGYLITNPRELIHQYATTTPIAIMDVSFKETIDFKSRF